jgi:di/tricarboxylate transporter
MFEFSPVGGAVLLGGVAFMTLVGRRLLPERDITREQGPTADLGQLFAFHERLGYLRLPAVSALAGRSLFASRLGAALGLNVLAILRKDERLLAPDPGQPLRAGDRLVVEGRLDRLEELRGRENLALDEMRVEIGQLMSGDNLFIEAHIAPESGLVGQSLMQTGFRHRFGVHILAIRHDGVSQRSALRDRVLQAHDCLLIQTTQAQLGRLRDTTDFSSIEPLGAAQVAERYALEDQLLSLSIPEGSGLAGRSLAESRLGDALGLSVLGIMRGGQVRLAPQPEDRLEVGDHLLAEGRPEDLEVLRGLNELEIERGSAVNMEELESDQVGLAGVVLSPQTALAGRTLRELHFREKFGLSVLAIWRAGRAYRSNLRDVPLRFGDALLLYGPRSRLKLLGSEPDFLVLLEEAQEPPRSRKAPVAVLIMLGVLVPAVLGAVPIAIAAVVGATLMVLTGCLTMEEAYRHIEWRAVFLMAGMLPLGIAMQQTGAADLVGRAVMEISGPLGPAGVMAGVYLITTLITQVMPTPAVVVLMAPVAISAGFDMGLSPHAMAMIVAVAAAGNSLNPVAHPANSLVMGPGGYRFMDYLKVGLPLIGLILVISMALVPVLWRP